MKKIMILPICVLLLFSWLYAEDVVLLQNSIVDESALNFAKGDQTRFSTNINGRTYQQYPQATYNGYQYTTYYDSDRRVCVGRRALPDGPWEVIHFQDYTMGGSDSHNVTAVGICTADGTIHLAFDHHAEALNYRVSVQGVVTDPESVIWEASLFGPVTNYLGSVGPITALTYPRFISAPNGNLYLYYRYGGSGSGDGMIQEYDGTAHTWTPGLGKFISRQGTYDGPVTPNSTSRNPYINGISFAGNRLHASWGWRETGSTATSNHDICYAYSDDYGRTWCNNNGDAIGITGSSYINVDSPGLVVADIEQGIGLSNQYTHYAYPDGSVHVMVRHNNPGTSTSVYQHYWRNPAGLWGHQALSLSGSRPKLAGADDGALFLVYSTGGHINIAKGVPNGDLTNWSWSNVYTQPETSGGEGHFDVMRWKSEGILSVYDQESPAVVLDYGSGTPINGMPSPLHVYDYDVGYATQELPTLIHYPLDGNLDDAGEDGLDGTLIGGSFAPSLVEYDQGLVLDGVDDYVAITGYQGLTGTASRTCSAWIKTTGSANNMAILNWGTIAPGQQWLFGVYSTGQLGVYAGGPDIVTTALVADGLWHHVAAVMTDDGSPSTDEIQLYIDGIPQGTQASSTEPVNTVADGDVVMGAFEYNPGQMGFYFNGQMDDVRIYSSALTEAEIQALASITPPSPDLVRDYVINLGDLSALASYWLSDDCFSWDLCDGRDLNADQLVNQDDVLVLAERWLKLHDPPLVIPVEDFETYAVDTRMNGLTSGGLLGGLWDIQDEGNNNESKDGVVVADTDNPDNMVMKIENGYLSYRALSVSQFNDPIEEGQTGALFFQLMYAEDGINGVLEFEAGIHAFAMDDDDPLTLTNGNDLTNIVAGFGAVNTSASTFDITTIDGSSVLMSNLDRYTWYNVWIIADNGADMYDLYIGPSGPSDQLPEAPIVADIPFNGTTTQALTGGLWLVGKSESSRGATVRLDEIAWSGEFY